ncbi:MAG: hypothetical protein ABWY93_29770 [Mycobacterium sp.]
MRPFDPRRRRLALSIAGCLLITLAGGLIVIARHGPDPGQTATAARPDLSVLTESMLIDQGAVPAVAGTSWGAMVAVPRGAAPPVSPPGCGVFLSQTEALQTGLAMRSAKGTAIGVELDVTQRPLDLDALVAQCASFTYDGGRTQSSVTMEPLGLADLPADTVGTLMHCRSVTGAKTLGWDIAMIVGYHRGLLVTAQYTPGPVGGPFDQKLADSLAGMYRAQVAKLDHT